MNLSFSEKWTNDYGFFFGLLATFLLCPIFSIYFIVDGMMKNKKSAYFVFALFMGLLAFMLAPISDLASYAFMYYKFKNHSLLYVFEQAYIRKDFVMHCLLWIFSYLDIPFGFFTAFFTVISFLLLNHIFLDMIDKTGTLYTPKEVIARYFFYISVFPFILLVGGVRFGFAVVIMIYGYFLYFDKNLKLLGVTVAFLASFVHFSLFYFFLASFFLVQFKIERKYALLLLLLMFLVSLPLQKYIQAYLVGQDAVGSDYLGDGVWGRQEGQTLGIKALAYHWGQRIFLLPLIFLYFKQYDKMEKWGRLFFAFLLFFSFGYSAFTIAQRLTVIFLTLSIFIYLREESKGYYPTLYQSIIFICSCLLICSFDLFAHREQILLSDYWRLVQPVPLTLTQGYDKEWLFINARSRFY